MGNYTETYESLMNKSDLACLKAIEFAKKGDWVMSKYWKDASNGFKERARNLNR